MKKIFSLMLALTATVTLSACGGISEHDYQALLAEKEELATQVDELQSKLDEVPVTFSGSFTASVIQIIPGYVLDNETPMCATVTCFQDSPFTIYLGEELTAQLAVGKTYQFQIEEKTVMLTQAQIEDISTAPETAIPQYGLQISSVSETDKVGLDASSLEFRYS